jgi:ribonuclease HI
VDGAFKPDTGQGGWGAVIRNSGGVVVRASAGNIRHAMDAFHAELLAAREGVRMAVEAGMGRVTLEIDSMLVKLAMQNDSFRLSALGRIVW